MIRYALVCNKGHEFESWFQDSAAYDRQARRGLISCPFCNSTKVRKAMMAPRLAGRRKRAMEVSSAPVTEASKTVAMMSPQERELRAKLKELRDHIVRNAEDVGPRFPEEARKIHYGEIEHRSIYGVASAEEARELAEEGIEFHPLPVLPEDRN